MISDVFGLNAVYEKQTEKTWAEDPNFGYLGGGGIINASPPPTYINTCSIERLDFSTETSSNPPANLPVAVNELAAVSNNTYGYFVGGPLSCTIQRLDFSTETASNPPGNLYEERSRTSAVSTPQYGYIGGGLSPSISNVTCSIIRFDFSTEISSTPSTAYLRTAARGNTAAVSNSSYGYFAGGDAPLVPQFYNQINRFDLSNETVAAPGPVANLTQTRGSLAGVSNSSYGYFGGGSYFPPLQRYVTIDRLEFSTETTSSPPADLSQPRASLAGVSNNSYGYFAGGQTAPTTVVNTIDRLDFLTETRSLPGNGLVQARSNFATTSSGKTGVNVDHRRKTSSTDVDGNPISNSYGYFAGGFAPPRVNTIDRLDFSNETVAAPGAYQLSQIRNILTAVSSSNYGYFAGGFTPPRTNTIDRLDFSNETMALPGNNLNDGRNLMAGVSNSNYGYIGGGFIDPVPGRTCTIERLDFSNETLAAPGTFQLREAREELTAVSNPKIGAYFAGGQTLPTTVSTIDRLDFYTETTSNPPADLSQARMDLTGISNSDYGYFAGGDPAVNTIDRLDFSNDTVSEPGNNLPQARYELAAVSNNSYAYFGGGRNPSYQNTIERLDFSNETLDLPGNHLTQARAGLAAVSN